MSIPVTETVICDASANTIWKALTEAELMKEWYFVVYDFQLKEGNQFFFYEPGENKKFKHVCTILDVKPNVKFSHTWTYPELTNGESVLSWYLSENGQQTTVRLTHEGLETFADGGTDFDRENFVAGWNDILHNSLKSFVENKI